MRKITVPACYYQQFDANRNLEFPAEAYGGWMKADLPLDLAHTALVVMHAWDCGSWDEYPGWHRAVEYIPRSGDISRKVFPSLLDAVRASGMKLFHVVAPQHHYYEKYEGYQQTVQLAGEEEQACERIQPDSAYQELLQFKTEHSFPGAHNRDDIRRGRDSIHFTAEAEPLPGEGIAKNASQLFALCKQHGINHLIYTGFAINGCLMVSPGGMIDMQKRGLICSAVRQAVTAIENKESVRDESAKENALWQVALFYGFVYDAQDLMLALTSED